MGDDARIAGLLRTTEWACEEMAHGLPAGRVTEQEMTDLAERLEGMAQLLRLRALGDAHTETRRIEEAPGEDQSR